MTKSLATYVSFPGYTAEVFEHWKDVFGGELMILRYRDTQLEGMPFEPDPDAVAHVTLSLPGGELAGGAVRTGAVGRMVRAGVRPVRRHVGVFLRERVNHSPGTRNRVGLKGDERSAS